MNFPNVTGLSLGTTGTLAGKRFTVVGRVVMGMEEGGQTYYWNEFHLVDEANQSATLVYEETERGGQWKLFTYVESTHPLTAYEAAAKRVGDRVSVDGQTAHVTLVDESKVCFIEGRPPEGVEMGDVAKYFNAVADNRMYVVSWTGPEVEIFRGMDLPTQAITAAFHLPPPLGPLARPPLLSTESDGSGKKGIVQWVVLLAIIGSVGLIIFAFRSTSRANKAIAPVKQSAPAPPLVTGATGQLRGKPLQVAGHALVEIRTPTSTYERHEYHLAGDDNATALLIYGLDARRTTWWLLQPVQLDTPLSPVEAAAKRAGSSVNVQGESMVIKQLFLSTVRSAEGQLPSSLASGPAAYNFRAEAKGTVLLVRWTESGITGHVGKLIPAVEVMAGLGNKAEATR
jgi:hypothetical protein